MSIITLQHFKKPNELNIPLAESYPVANASAVPPSDVDAIEYLIDKVEREVLLGALGATAYNELLLALPDLDNPVNAKWKALVEGQTYGDGKVWTGLDNDYSLLAFKVKCDYLFQNAQSVSGIGVTESKPEKGVRISPQQTIANMSLNFTTKYQGVYMNEPVIYNNGQFIDWFGCAYSPEVSLYEFLFDNRTTYTTVDLQKFRFFTPYNSFGI